MFYKWLVISRFRIYQLDVIVFILIIEYQMVIMVVFKMIDIKLHLVPYVLFKIMDIGLLYKEVLDDEIGYGAGPGNARGRFHNVKAGSKSCNAVAATCV